MYKHKDVIPRNGESGIALLIVLFAMVALSVVGLGMMYSTNMETAINSNYRDKQVSFYAALSGLQEGRERIKYPYSITPPTALPSTALQDIVYIVSDYSKVKPWDPSNSYFDTELCQEKVLNLHGTYGVPCTTIASGTGWFRYIDDGQSSSAPWYFASPTDWKWTRIQLKGNNNTPVPVNGDSGSYDQACWDGTRQISTATGYSGGCEPVGGVTSVIVDEGGTNYTSTPTVTFSSGGGSGAAATAVLGPEIRSYISDITVTAGGSGYASAPTVVISSGSATATAVLSTTGTSVVTGGSVTSVSVTAHGSGYTTPPAVAFSGGGGSGATATAVLSSAGTTTTNGYVNALTLTAGGSGYTTAPAVTFSGGGGGNGATATSTLGTAGGIKSVALTSPGTQCYGTASDAVISFAGGGGTGATASAVLETGKSCIVSVTVPGSPACKNPLDTKHGYNPTNQKSGVTFAVAGQNGSFSGTLFSKSPMSMSVQNPGYDPTGYSAATFTSNLQVIGSGTAWTDCGNITVTATTGYRIASINVTNGGTGYTSTPTVTITGGVGTTSNPAATATLGFPVTALTLTNGGTGYMSAPTAVLTGDGAGATATASIITTSTTTYSVAAINVTGGGIGYTSPPTVNLSGGGGTLAAATAAVNTLTVTTYPVASITVNSGGSGYDVSAPPTVTLTGGGGTGATATATVSTMETGLLAVDHIDVVTAGTKYSSNPTVTLTGGGGSGAAATAQISGGTKYGKVWLLTSLAQTRSGARSLVQMEVASPVLGFATGGALTLDGPNPVMDAMPNSSNFFIHGNDANSCLQTPEPKHPAITGYDDPGADPPTHSVATITGSLPRPANYTGAGGTPSVQNGYASLGETMGTPAGMESVIAAIYNTPGARHYDSSNVGTFTPSTTKNSSISYIDGNLTLTGNGSGRGILVVTGTLTMSGNFTWRGTVFVVGDGHIEMNGGGTGSIIGSMWAAKIWDSNATKNLLDKMGSPTFKWNGGGVNGVQYDHCYTTNLMNAVSTANLVSTRPLKVLSLRVLPY